MLYPFKNAISIVIPVYNEEESIGALLEEITAALTSSSLTYEVIVVDDASHDATIQVLQHAQKRSPNLRVLKHCNNQGQTAALFTGIQHACYDWIVSLDGDGQNDPMDITKLISALNQNNDASLGLLIAGQRVHRQDTWLKKVSSKIANNVRRAILHDNCMDTGCSLKLFPRDAILSLPRFNHFHRFIPAMLELKKIPTINLPVNHRNRVFGVSKYGLNNRLWVGITDMLGVRWLKKRYLHAITITEITNKQP